MGGHYATGYRQIRYVCNWSKYLWDDVFFNFVRDSIKKKGFSEILGYLCMSITSVTIVQIRNISILDLDVREKWRSCYLRVRFFGQCSGRY